MSPATAAAAQYLARLEALDTESLEPDFADWIAVRLAAAAAAEGRPDVVLGPVPCRGCGESISWTGAAWIGADGWTHECTGRRVG